MEIQTINLIIGWLGVLFYIKRKPIAPYLNLINAVLSMYIYASAGIYGMITLLPFIFVNIWLIYSKYEKKEQRNMQIWVIAITLIIGAITQFINEYTNSGGGLTALTTLFNTFALMSQIINYKHTQKLWLIANLCYMLHAFMYGLPIVGFENSGYLLLSIYGVYKERVK
jgi:hypothetical protein